MYRYPDVIKAVNFSRQNGLVTAVRGGGHNWAGKATCDDGIIIDLSLMRRVLVDAKTKTAQVDGGALLGDGWKKLVALKNKYDPENLFRLNQNISPSA